MSFDTQIICDRKCIAVSKSLDPIVDGGSYKDPIILFHKNKVQLLCCGYIRSHFNSNLNPNDIGSIVSKLASFEFSGRYLIFAAKKAHEYSSSWTSLAIFNNLALNSLIYPPKLDLQSKSNMSGKFQFLNAISNNFNDHQDTRSHSISFRPLHQPKNDFYFGKIHGWTIEYGIIGIPKYDKYMDSLTMFFRLYKQNNCDSFRHCQKVVKKYFRNSCQMYYVTCRYWTNVDNDSCVDVRINRFHNSEECLFDFQYPAPGHGSSDAEGDPDLAEQYKDLFLLKKNDSFQIRIEKHVKKIDNSKELSSSSSDGVIEKKENDKDKDKDKAKDDKPVNYFYLSFWKNYQQIIGQDTIGINGKIGLNFDQFDYFFGITSQVAKYNNKKLGFVLECQTESS